ncbi:MAG: amino acid adenylation domain-containing protein, partial [bacterium]|nr:amino acid adenylation domain-containing protein [bacterium]
VNQHLMEDLGNKFVETAAPLWRIRVCFLDRDNVFIAFICHHAILDGWSFASFMTELYRLDRELETNPGYVPQTLTCTYKDAVVKELVEKRKSENITYWQTELQDYKRIDFFGKQKKSDELMEVTGPFYDEVFFGRLSEAAKMHNSTIKNLCFAAYIYIMNMLSYEDDIVVGLVSNNRPVSADGDKVLGCFLNTVPVRFKMSHGLGWVGYIGMVEEKLLEVKKYEGLPLFDILTAVRGLNKHNRGTQGLFETLFNFVDFHVYDKLREYRADNNIDISAHMNTNTQFDMEISATLGTLSIGAKHNPSSINRTFADKLCISVKRILDKFIFEPGVLMRRSDIIPAEEKKKILEDFNDTKAEYSRDKTIPELFREQVEKTPGNSAVIFDGTAITYNELNIKSNQLARLLKEKGVEPGRLVAVMMDRCIEMIVSVMAILKAGGAYVPLEPYLPDERIRKLLESLAIETAATNELQLEKAGRIAGELPRLENILCPDRDRDRLREYSWEDLPPAATAEDIAYIIFTSGSTGTPKGVVESHRPVINVIEWVNKTFNVNPSDKLLFITSLGFDLSVYDIFGILAAGACLRLVKAADIKDPKTLLDIIMNEGITFWDSAPAALQQLVPFLPEVREYEISSRLRLVFLSGDWIPVSMPDALRGVFTGVRVVSLGGATEATIWSNYYPIGEVDPTWPSIPYGKPIQNAGYYILDQHLEICPLLIPGDLYVGGECLASEYKNDPQLSAAKFLENPFVPGEKIYKTGDVARWFEDGNMQFLGRKDHQVKIRGFRIELGEIESQLAGHPGVSDCIVLDRSDGGGNKFLCAYFVAAPDVPVNKEVLKEHLAAELPEYMIPSYFIGIDKIPVSPNGKVDRKALPEPEGDEDGARYAPPRNETEEKLVEIWSHVLEDAVIGIDSDFFQVGGHSLNAAMVVSKIHKELNVKIPLAELFHKPTIRQLSAVIHVSARETFAAVEPVEEREYYPLSSAQKRLYILQRLDPGNTVYNIPQVLTLTGELDKTKLEKSFSRLIRRHESFRTAFLTVADEPVQRIHKAGIWDQGIGIRVEVGAPRPGEFIKPFDLSRAPLLRVGVFQTGEREHILVVDMHHIISDGSSMGILSAEMMAYYSGETLAPLTVRYKDISMWQERRGASRRLREQETFWRRQFPGEIPVLDLPVDFPRPAVQRFE